jgi:hypothetical protein
MNKNKLPKGTLLYRDANEKKNRSCIFWFRNMLNVFYIYFI